MAKFFLLTLLIVSVTFSQSISSRINKVISDKFFDTCLIAIHVEDLTTNKTLFKKNEKMLLRPASNMKIITSAAGLIFLGEYYEFKTNLYYDGKIVNDTLYGDLFVEGGCDPDFTTQDFYAFVTALKNLNINFITGNLYGDLSFKDSLYWGNGWMWDDDPSSDAPRLSALNLNDNCVEIIVTKDSVKFFPNTEFVNLIKFESDSDSYVNRDWLNNTNDIIVKGMTNNSVYKKINIVNPEKYFLKVFKEVLDSSGIRVTGEVGFSRVSEDAILIASFGRKYSEVINNLNKESDNLSAEMTLYALSEKLFGRPASAEAGLKILYFLIDSLGLNSKNYRLADGSGVSHYNVVSTELLAKLLKYIYYNHPDKFKILYDSFPIAGIDGTLKNRMNRSNAFNNVRAKTGTLSGVSCISGFVTTKKNHLLAFSIMMQNFVGSSYKARQFQDEICKILSEIN